MQRNIDRWVCQEVPDTILGPRARSPIDFCIHGLKEMVSWNIASTEGGGKHINTTAKLISDVNLDN